MRKPVSRLITLGLLGLLTAPGAWAQSQPALTGQVLDATGRPVVGATVVEDGTNNGTSTDASGRFVLRPRKATPALTIRSIGFEAQHVTGSAEAMKVSLTESATALGAVQVVGSRASNRSVTDSPAPVDLIDIREVTTKTGQLDVNQLLQFVAPSFNSNRQTGSDGADHVDPASLRGLGPDQTLVLVNGKRWHQSALVNLFGTRGRGNTGYDLNTVPAAAIERIEILRDGASAQYGSDAIAGVINIVLKSSTKELSANVNYSAYQAKYRFDDQKYDGGNVDANLNYGGAVGQKGGFLNGTLDFNQRKHTQRANVLGGDANGPDGDGNGLARRNYGDPQVINSSAYVNGRFPLSEKAYLYTFGGLNLRQGDAYAWSRFRQVRDSATGPAYPNPNNVPSIYPNGFDPIITSHIIDGHVVAGLRATLGEWDMDVSNNFGANRFEYGVRNTLNATLGDISPTEFDAGGFQLQQNVAGLSFTRNYKTVMQGLNLAFGTEWRHERYQLFAGEAMSYRNYDPTSGASGGSQGFPGFQPANEVTAERDNVGVYADAELNVSQRWLLAGALRYEHYSDFGSTLNYKAATRFHLTDFLTLRGTYSTGFRAPSLAQINFNTVFTNFENGQPVQVLLAANGSDVTRKADIPALKQEKSQNVSAGLTSRLGGSLTLTVDGYYVKVKDRIVLTDYFKADDDVIGADLTALGVEKAQFFANAVSTSTTGLDVVLTHVATLGDGRLTTALAGNLNHMKIDRVSTAGRLVGKEDAFFGPREQAFVKASAPPSKVNLTVDYRIGRWSALVRVVRFDRVKLLNYDLELQKYSPRLTTDLALSCAFTNHLQASIGSSNIFDVYPNRFDPATTESGGAWDPVQMGANGRQLFAKLQARF